MTQKEYIRELSYQTKIPQHTVKEIVKAQAKVITEAIKDEDFIQLYQGLTVGGKMRKPITINHPQTGELKTIDSHIVPFARFSQRYRKKVWGGLE